MIVIADTSPLCYLVLIHQIDILPALYSQITIPKAVADELAASASPELIQQWIVQPPRWLHINVMEVPETLDLQLDNLDPGERAVIFLATQMMADLVVLDDKSARQVARSRGLAVIGLLGILKEASVTQQLDLAVTFENLRQAGFWVSPRLLDQLLQHD